MRQRTDEFNQIIGNMQEGLVLLDEKENVLSINAAAMKLFGVEENCVGQSFLTVDRNHEISLAIQQSLSDGHAEIRCHRGGRVYQFDLSRIDSDGRVGRRSAAGLRYYRAGIRRAQPPGVHRQCVS